MKEPVMTGMIDQILNYFKSETVITFAFQGGEPTCAGIDWFQKFIDNVSLRKKKYHRIIYSIQTNGILLNDKWAAFLKKTISLLEFQLMGRSRCMISSEFTLWEQELMTR